MLRSVASCILLASSLPALADDLPRIGVVGIHQASLDPADQERAIQQIVAAIEATGRFDALSPAEIATTLVGREAIVVEDGLLAFGRLQLANGKNAYNQASPDDAIPWLESAIESLRAAFSGTNDAADLWEAWVWLGASHLQRDPPDEAAAAALSQAYALAPSRPLNPATYPPNVVELFDRRARELEGRAALAVTTDLPANVWVDGVDRGPSPADVQGVVPGVHHVLARAPGAQSYLQVEVPPVDPAAPTAPQPIALTLGPVRLGEGAASASGRSAEIAAIYRSLGKRSEGLDYLLIIGVSDSMLEVQLLSTSIDTFSKPIELPYVDDADDEAAQAVPLLLNGVDPSGAFGATSPTAVPIDVAANTALALLLTQQIAPVAVGGPEVEPPVVPPKKKSKVGVVLGVVGGVLVAGAAGTGTWLYLQSQEEPAPADQGVIVVQF